MRQLDPVRGLHDGVVGSFIPVAGKAPEVWFSGTIKVDDDGVEIAVMASHPEDLAGTWADDPDNHEVVFGVTEIGNILIRVRSVTRSTTRGEYVAQVVRWRGTAVLINPLSNDVETDTVTSLSLNYFGLLSWTRHNTVDEPVVEPDRGIVGWRYEASSVEPETVDLDEGYRVTFGGRAIPDGPPDRRTILTPLNVRVSSNERQPLDDHLQRLDAIHALLSLAHHDPVKASAGFARLDLADTGRKGTLLWDRTMMSGGDTGAINEFPIFTLDDINGLEGVAAWVRTCLEQNRSVTPLVRHRLFDNQTAESRLLSTAAAIDNWVSAHRHTHDWAERPTKAEARRRKLKPSKASHDLNRSVSPAWDTWIGDPDRWATLFWDTYDKLKHEHAAELDVNEIHQLEFSGRWLLTASILDECAGSQSASERIFSRGLAYPASKNVRETLGLPSPDES